MVSISKLVLGVTILALFWMPSLQRAAAQTQFVGKDYFPAELEFRELRSVSSEKSGEGVAALPDGEEAPIFAEAGFLRYARRTYATGTGSDLTVEVLTAKDEKAAYSLLSLLRSSKIVPGPPGDAYALFDRGLMFVRGAFWVRIAGSSAPELYRRIALSVSNRIGARKNAIPSLVAHLPQIGLDQNSVRYFLGPISLRTYGVDFLHASKVFGPEMEITQALYSQGGASGMLSVISFPTSQAAESYFDNLPSHEGSAEAMKAAKRYAKRVGPIVGILQGSFEPPNADKILQSLKYTYSITWIYDKNERNSATLWGVPVGILGTVVRSLLLTALLCGLSLLLGVGMATFRVLLRGYAPNNFLDRPERTGMIRLRLNDGPIPPAASSQKTGMNHNT